MQMFEIKPHSMSTSTTMIANNCFKQDTPSTQKGIYYQDVLRAQKTTTKKQLEEG